MTLGKELLKNSGLSDKARDELHEVLDEIVSAINDIQDNYAGHLADDTAHNSADTTNTLSDSNITDIDSR